MGGAVSITFAPQINGQVADAAYINSIAYAVEEHDAALEAMSVDVHGVGKYLTTAATKATSASTTEVAVADYALTVDVPAGRIVEFVARVRVQSTIAADAAMFRLRQTSVSGTIGGEERVPLVAAATPYERTLVFPWRSNGASLTWLLTVHRITGTGSVTVTTGGSTLPGIFYVRDVVADTQFTIV